MKNFGETFKEWWVSLQYYYSNTDPIVLKSCSSKADLTQKIIGSTVILSALLASLGGLMFISEAFKNIIVILFAGIVWFLTISNFDRSLFLANSKKILVARLIIIIGIAVPVSTVLKLKFLEKDINHQLELMYQEKNAERYDPVNELEGEFKGKANRIDNELFKLGRELLATKRLRDAEASGLRYGNSSGIQGKGKKWRAYNQQVNAIQSRINQLNERKELLEQQFIKEKTVKQGRIDRNQLPRNSSLLARYIAFKKLLNHPDDEVRSGAQSISIALTLIIGLMEIFPVVLKAFLGTTPYNEYINDQEALIVRAVKHRNEYAKEWIKQVHERPLPEQNQEEEVKVRLNTFNMIIDNIKKGHETT